jgi:xanthine dehydrogenase small subunit
VRRRVALADFYVGYMKNRLEPGEFIEAIEVPRPGAATHVRAYKLSKRYDCDISAVSAGLAIDLVDGRVARARFGFGGMDAIARRALLAEAAVTGRPWNEATVREGIAALAGDFAPIDDLRASAAYRRQVAGNLLMRLYLETRSDAPLARDATTVWPARTAAT